MLGIFIPGFFLIGAYGLASSIHIAASVNLIVGAASWIVARRYDAGLSTAAEEPTSGSDISTPATTHRAMPALDAGAPAPGGGTTPKKPGSGLYRKSLIAYGVSGFLALGYECSASGVSD